MDNQEELSCDELASLRIVYWAWMDGFYCHDRRGRYRTQVRPLHSGCLRHSGFIYVCGLFSFAVISSSIFSGRDFRWKLKLPLILHVLRFDAACRCCLESMMDEGMIRVSFESFMAYNNIEWGLLP